MKHSFYFVHTELHYLYKQLTDFLLFEKIVNLTNKNVHLNFAGLQEIVNLKASMNLGVSDLIKSEFPKLTPAFREKIEVTNIPDPNWISGFVSGEGTFDVKIYKSKTIIGYAVQLRFRIPQHERDKKLMELLIKYFDNYHLFADKYIQYLKFRKTYIMITKGLHLEDKGIKKIISIKKAY